MLGDNIKKYRKLKRWNLETLGKKLGVSRQAVWAWEAGIDKPGGKVQIKEIARVLGVKTKDLTGKDDPEDLIRENENLKNRLIEKEKRVNLLEEQNEELEKRIQDIKNKLGGLFD